MDLRNKRHIFFDLDDTLWDFAANSTNALSVLFAEFDLASKLKIHLQEFLNTYHKINLEMWSLYYKRAIDKKFMREERFHEVFRRYGFDNRKLSVDFSEAYLALAPKGRLLKPNCLETLEYLAPKYKLHIITNGFIESQAIKMDGAGIRHYFTHVIISEEHALVKPQTEIFRLAEKLVSSTPDLCVMIGDSLESDIEGAKGAGWDALLYSQRSDAAYKGPKISDLKELQAIF